MGFGDSVNFGLVTVGDGELLSCNGGLIEGLGIEDGTSSDVVREEEGEREGDVVEARDEGETATGRLVGVEN